MTSSGPDGNRPLRLLVMCNANQCRSPMAGVLARTILQRWGVPANVTTCGILDAGYPAVARATAEMRRRGLDLSDHHSQRLDPDLLADTDLVLTMERRQLVALADMDMGAIERSFTLKELADLANLIGRRRPDQSIGDWIASAHRARFANPLVYDTTDDVHDPTGRSKRAFRATADEISSLLETVLGHLVAPAKAP
jgi:protein-tyrosine-phosphatase